MALSPLDPEANTLGPNYIQLGMVGGRIAIAGG